MLLENSRNWLSTVCLGVVTIACQETASENTASTIGTALSFDEWKAANRVPRARNKYAVGDWATPLVLVGDDDARAYFERHVLKRDGNDQNLIIDNGQRSPGDPVPGTNYAFARGSTLLYCIDRASLRLVTSRYGLPAGTDLYPIVDFAFADAAAAWNTVSGLNITKELGRDESCSPRANDDITWYVQPFALNPSDPLEHLTFVLAPKYNLDPAQSPPADNRSFLIVDYLIQRYAPGAFIAANDPNWNQLFSFSGLMTRAVGMGLGFISEQNRLQADDGTVIWPESCRDSSVGGIFLTDADPYSVTTHPISMAPILDSASQPCKGARPFDYAISYGDAMGASCQYQKPSASYFYYCNSSVQKSIRNAQPPQCSPVPLSPGGPGDCNGVDWNGVKDGAQEWTGAVIWGTID